MYDMHPRPFYMGVSPRLVLCQAPGCVDYCLMRYDGPSGMPFFDFYGKFWSVLLVLKG